MALSKADQKTQKLARDLLDILEKHARDAKTHGVPRDVYVRAVADHAAHTFDMLTSGKS